MNKVLLIPLLIALTSILLTVVWHRITTYSKVAPKIPIQWWGHGETGESDLTVRPFVVNISDYVISDLRKRLQLTRPFQLPLDGVGFTYGFNTNYLNNILEFWRNNYSWSEQQVFLNSLPQFTTEVAGLRLHYIHIKPSVSSQVKVLPVLVLHGWAESVRNLYEFLPLLTKQRPGEDFVFEVIAPALPGFAFSQSTNKPGLGSVQLAVLFDTFMQQLGYKQYYVQGGDFGGYIGTYMAQLFPERVAGLHITMCIIQFSASSLIQLLIGSVFPSLVLEEHEAKHIYPLSQYFKFTVEETGYFHEQCTKPDTIGVALNESPIGLAAYILEKYSTLTDPSWRELPDGGLQDKYKLRDLLDIIMMYWLSGSVTSSMRLYSESFNLKQFQLHMADVSVQVPSACARFPHEISFTPVSLLRQKFTNLVQLTDFDSGGHFASFENPTQLADDFWAAVKKMLLLQSSNV